MIPKEHGSWAVLAVPLLAGLLAAPGAALAPSLLFAAAALAAFLTRPALLALLAARADGALARRAAALSAASAAAFAALLLAHGRWGLLWFGAAVAPLALLEARAHLKRQALSWSRELAGVAGLSLGGPAAYYAACGELPASAWLLGAACGAYFVGPIFHVKMAALQHRAFADASVRPRLDAAVRASLAYHGAALLAASAAALAGLLPPAVALPFALALAKTAVRAGRGPEPVRFRSLGYQEVALSAVFLACLTALSAS